MREAYIYTFTGKRFYPFAPGPDQIDIQDIAHGLALKCRFSGHTREFYSTAQHSVHVMELMQPWDRLYGLLHDAAEAYLVDLPSPIKRTLEKRDIYIFADMEAGIMEAIKNRFTLSKPPVDMKYADNVLCSTEVRDLMPPGEYFVHKSSTPALARRIDPWDWRKAKALFLQAFETEWDLHKNRILKAVEVW